MIVLNQEHERSSRLTDEQKQLIEENIEFAKKVGFKSNAAKTLNHDDVVDLAIEALIKAAACYDTSRQSKFTTYAYRVIQNHLVDAVKRLNREILIESFDEEEAGHQEANSGVNEFKKYQLYDYLIQHQHEREINLLIHRYFADEDKPTTQADLTAFYNLSQSQLSHLERKAKERIRKELGIF